MREKNTSQYASFGYRFAAMMIDNIIFALLLSPVFTMIFGVKDYTDEEIKQILQTDGMLSLVNPTEIAIQQLTILAITVFFWLRFAGTPGKRLLKIRVVDATTGKHLTLLQSIIRYLGYLISSFPMGLGFIWVLFDEKNQGWHDKLANSVVVRDQGQTLQKIQKAPYDSNDTDNDVFTA